MTPATLTVATDSADKAYDGEALTAEGSITGLKNDETVTFGVTGSQTDAGESANSYSLVFDGTAKESNYVISENIGTLNVAPLTTVVVTITGYRFNNGQKWTIPEEYRNPSQPAVSIYWNPYAAPVTVPNYEESENG